MAGRVNEELREDSVQCHEGKDTRFFSKGNGESWRVLNQRK